MTRMALVKGAIIINKRKEWEGINRKQSTRWQHLSRLKASAFFSLQFFLAVLWNTATYTWDWYCHLVGDRASLQCYHNLAYPVSQSFNRIWTIRRRKRGRSAWKRSTPSGGCWRNKARPELIEFPVSLFTSTGAGKPYWRGRLSTVDLLVLTSLNQLLLLLKILSTFVTK